MDPHLGYSDADSQSCAIERVRLESDQISYKADLLRVSVVSDEMENKIANGGRHEGCKKHAQPFVIFKKSEEGGKEEEVNQKFLEIVVVPVPKFDQRPRRYRSVCIAEQSKSGKPRGSDNRASPDRHIQHIFKEQVDQKGPADIPREGLTCDVLGYGMIETWKSENRIRKVAQQKAEKHEYVDPHKQLEAL
jgi:hypothetical protein